MVGVRFAIPSKFAHSEHADKRFVRCQRDDFTVQVSQTANMPDKTPFPSNLRAARKAKGWTLEQAAAAAETSRGYLSDLERGVRPMPPGAKLEKIALALDTTVSALAGGLFRGRVGQVRCQRTFLLIESSLCANVSPRQGDTPCSPPSPDTTPKR